VENLENWNNALLQMKKKHPNRIFHLSSRWDDVAGLEVIPCWGVANPPPAMVGPNES